jgi:cell division protein YceG involved in septum cleavage
MFRAFVRLSAAQRRGVLQGATFAGALIIGMAMGWLVAVSLLERVNPAPPTPTSAAALGSATPVPLVGVPPTPTNTAEPIQLFVSTPTQTLAALLATPSAMPPIGGDVLTVTGTAIALDLVSTLTNTPEPAITYVIVTPIPPTEAPTLPPPTVTPTEAPCVHPEGWASYQIQPGDTWFGFQLGANNTVDVEALKKGNCLSSNILQIGQVIFLPPGIADKSPKLDDVESADDGGDPNSATRGGANCPCSLRVREGYRREQVAARIDKLPASFSGRDFLAATGADAQISGYWFLSGRPAGATLEGFMFPGDYTIENTTTAADLRKMMLDRFAASVDSGLEGAAAAQGFNFWQLVNLASIIQRESYDANEQKLVASVMHNRIRAEKGLASFVTLQYALGSAGDWWPRITSGNINTDTRYNTSKYRGLPPTPISSPGLSAILAAAYPAQTDYLYFNAKCEGGGNYYARTWEEFKAGLDCSNK